MASDHRCITPPAARKLSILSFSSWASDDSLATNHTANDRTALQRRRLNNPPRASPMQPAADAPYRGRFAPSPTGPLHFGSLVAAVGAYLDALANNGQWLLRLENVDPPREQPGAADTILRQLDALGFSWCDEVVRQHERSDAYARALSRLRNADRVFDCICTRKQILAQARRGPDGDVIYPGACRRRPVKRADGASVRFKVSAAACRVADRIQGEYRQHLSRSVGDFVIRRADGRYAYHLAVVVDDAAQGVTHVVRGADLLPSTPRQIALQQALRLPTPRYAHLPVILGANGRKLSKQTHAAPLPVSPNRHQAIALIHQAVVCLNQPGILGVVDDIDDAWRLAASRWRIDRVPRTIKAAFH